MKYCFLVIRPFIFFCFIHAEQGREGGFIFFCIRKILGIKAAGKLARVIAAVGLVQNLGALNALVTCGIIKGHMKLHISNLAISSGATEAELPLLKQYLTERLEKNSRITGNDVQEILNQIRQEK